MTNFTCNSPDDFSISEFTKESDRKLLSSLSGPLPVKLTNDLLFHITFEKNRIALKGLMCSLLRLNPETIKTIDVLNPIETGSRIEAKTYILDLRILLNDDMVINIEMQVLRDDFWRDRSLVYLCRSFDMLNKGDLYSKVRAAVHIGILGFDLFPDYPEFYSDYILKNEKNASTYSSKIKLSVLNLNRTDLATKDDEIYKIKEWAQFFKSTTWEEVIQLSQTNEAIFEAARTIYYAAENRQIREKLEDRERSILYERTYKEDAREKAVQLFETKVELQNTTIELQNATAELQNVTAELQNTTAELQNTTAELQNKEAEIREQKAEIERLRAELAAMSK